MKYMAKQLEIAIKVALVLLTIALLLASAQLAGAATDGLVEVPVLRNKMRAGNVVRAEDVETRTMVQARISNRVIMEKEDIIGREATRTLRPQVPLYWESLRVPPDVRKDQSVILFFQHPGMFLQTDGRALEDGNVGARIRVMNVASSQLLSGTIVAPGQVRVE